MYRYIVVGFLSLALFISPHVSSAQSIEDLQAQIQQLLAVVASLQTQLLDQYGLSATDTPLTTTSSGFSCPSVPISGWLYLGVRDAGTGNQVSSLQRFLAQDSSLYPSGEITGYFGSLTARALQKFQEKNNLVFSGTPATTGYGATGPKTREAIRLSCGAATVPVPTKEPHVNITSPRGGESFGLNDEIFISWLDQDIRTVSIALYKNDKWVYWISKDRLVSGDKGGHNLTWDIPDNIMDIIGSGNNLKIYITGRLTDGSGYRDDKSEVFSISAVSDPTPTPYVSYISPVTVKRGDQVAIHGSGFNQTSRIQFPDQEGFSSERPVAWSPNILTFIVPQDLSIGQHNIRVNNSAMDGSGKGPSSNIRTISVVSSDTTVTITSISNSANPLVEGTAIGVATVDFSLHDFGGKIYVSGPIQVINNKWSHKVNTSLVNGQYSIVMWVNGIRKETDFVVNILTGSPTVTVLSPNGGETWQVGKTHTIRWDTTNYPSDSNVKLSLIDKRESLYDSSGRVTSLRDVVIRWVPNTGSYNFTVPSILGWMTLGGSDVYSVRIGASNVADQSDRWFSIVKPTETPTITLTAPNGGEQWRIGSTNTITWTPYQYGPDVNPSSDVTAYLEQKINGDYVTVGRILENGKASIHTMFEVNNTGNYANAGEYYVRIVNNKTGATDRSNASFTLLPRSTLTITKPQTSGIIHWYAAAIPFEITWSSENLDPGSSVSIVLSPRSVGTDYRIRENASPNGQYIWGGYDISGKQVPDGDYFLHICGTPPGGYGGICESLETIRVDNNWAATPVYSAMSSTGSIFGDDTYLANVEFKFTVTANGGDVFISKDISKALSTFTTANSASLTSIVISGSTAGDTTSSFKINNGSSRSFVYSGSIDNSGGTAGSKQFKVTGLNWGTTDSRNTANQVTSGLDALAVNVTLTVAANSSFNNIASVMSVSKELTKVISGLASFLAQYQN